MANKANQNDNAIIFAQKKIGTVFFQLLNKLRLFITFLLTGKCFFGNFSAFSNKNLKNLLKNNNLSIAYCSGVLKNHHEIELVPIPKRKRYHGISKVNIFSNQALFKQLNILYSGFLRTTAIYYVLYILIF